MFVARPARGAYNLLGLAPGGMMSRRVLAAAAALAIAMPAAASTSVSPSARPPRIEIVLPPAADRSPPAGFVTGLASSRLLPGARVRQARRGERAGVLACFRLQDLPLVPRARWMLDAAGFGGIELEVFRDGDLVRAVASVRLNPQAPELPLENTDLATPAMRDGDWAGAAVSLDTKRIVQWVIDIARREDRFTGQMLADALVVAKWNLGLDVEKDVAGALGGGLRALASRGSGDSVSLVADVREAEAFGRALESLAAASRLVPGAGARMEAARFGEATGYRVRTPWGAPAPAVLLVDDDKLIVSVSAQGPPPDPDGISKRLAPAGREDVPPALREIGECARCAAVVADVLECVRAAGDLVRAAGIEGSAPRASASLAWADGEAAVAVRVGGAGLQVWGVWRPSRSALAVTADDTMATR